MVQWPSELEALSKLEAKREVGEDEDATTSGSWEESICPSVRNGFMAFEVGFYLGNKANLCRLVLQQGRGRSFWLRGN